MVKTTPAGAPVRIGDVATVQFGDAGLHHRDGERQAGGAAEYLPAAGQQHGGRWPNAVHAEIANLKKDLPPGVDLQPFYDQSELVNDSITSVRDAILMGLVLASLIMVLFLRDWGTSLVAGLVIPATIGVTFIALRVMGQSFNLMTLGGLAAAVGLVIDDAIVVVENIVMHRDSGQIARGSDPQRDPRDSRAAGRVDHYADRGLSAADLHHRRYGRVLPRAGGHGGHGAADFAGAGAHLDSDAEPLLPAIPARRGGRAGEHETVPAAADARLRTHAALRAGAPAGAGGCSLSC